MIPLVFALFGVGETLLMEHDAGTVPLVVEGDLTLESWFQSIGCHVRRIRSSGRKLRNSPEVRSVVSWASPLIPSNSTPSPNHVSSPSGLTSQSHTSATGRWTVMETPICHPASLVFPMGIAA